MTGPLSDEQQRQRDVVAVVIEKSFHRSVRARQLALVQGRIHALFAAHRAEAQR